MAAAVPSMSRAFIFAALEAMKIPDWWINAARSLHENKYNFLLFRGRRYPGSSMTRGVKQGCPLSAILFVFIFDMAIRALCQTLGAQNNIVAAVADDIGMVLEIYMDTDTESSLHHGSLERSLFHGP